MDYPANDRGGLDPSTVKRTVWRSDKEKAALDRCDVCGKWDGEIAWLIVDRVDYDILARRPVGEYCSFGCLVSGANRLRADPRTESGDARR